MFEMFNYKSKTDMNTHLKLMNVKKYNCKLAKSGLQTIFLWQHKLPCQGHIRLFTQKGQSIKYCIYATLCMCSHLTWLY